MGSSSQVESDFDFQGHGLNEWESRFQLDVQDFHGTGNADDVLNWLAAVEVALGCANAPASKQVHLVATKFRRSAALWWMRQQLQEPPIETWKDLKRALKAAFLPYYSYDQYMRLQKLTKGSKCVKEYTTSFYNFLSSNVLHECPPWLVFQYIEGLRQDIKDELCGHSFDTVGEVAGEAEAAEKRLFNKKPKHETSPAIKNTNPPLLITPVSKHGIQPSTFKNLQRSLKCSASGKQGHLPFECPTSHVQLPTHAGSSDQTEMD